MWAVYLIPFSNQQFSLWGSVNDVLKFSSNGSTGVTCILLLNKTSEASIRILITEDFA